MYKYPNSWPRLTTCPSVTVVWKLPAIVAPPHTATTCPMAGAVNGDDLAHIFSVEGESRLDALARRVYRGLIPDHHT
jgi:hypothetical protein